MQNIWTDEQLKLAFYLYCILPFGKLHSRTPEIVDLASQINRTPSAVAMKLVNFASLDPIIINSGRKGLTGASANDRKIWVQFHANWTSMVEHYEPKYNSINQPNPTEIAPETKSSIKNIVQPKNAGTNIVRETEVRIGQNFFRQTILANYKNTCCISGLDVPTLLVASHISPWSLDSANRLNPSNGLCLSSLHDRAFDQGLISLDEDNQVIVSSKINKLTNSFVVETLLRYAGKRIQLPEKFAPSLEFTQMHRQTIFKH
jgi:putative restriction endonuclease